MAHPGEFEGMNTMLTAPAGREEEVGTLACFRNGQVIVSCWQLTPEELQAVIDSGGKVFLSIWGGRTQPPCYVASEESVLSVITEGMGAPGWK